MRYTIVLFLFIYKLGLGQVLSDPSHVRSYNPFSTLQIISSVKFENKLYVLYFSHTPKINIGGIDFESAPNCILCNRNYVVKYDSKNKIEKVIEIGSQKDSYGLPGATLYEANGHIFLTGHSRGNIIIDGIDIMESLPDGKLNGIMLEFDTELNYIKKYEFESGGFVTGIVYKDGEFIVAGNFGDTIVQYKNLILKHKTKRALNWDLREAFLIKIDANTGEPISGITFGGTGDSTIDKFSINKNGDLVLVGVSGEFIFEYQDLKFNTNEYPFNYSKYIMSISSDFDFIFFNEIESNNEFGSPYEIDFDNENNTYYLGKFEEKFILNEKLYAEEPGYFTLLIKFSKEGVFKWQKVLKNVNIKNIEIDKNNRIWASGYYRDTTFIDGVAFLPVQYNESTNVVLLSFAENNGKLVSHERVGTPMPFEVIDFKIREDNTFLFMANLNIGVSVAINIVDKIFYNALIKENASLLLFNYKREPNSIKEQSLPKVTIFPNPCSLGEAMNLTFDTTNKKSHQATLYDQYGKKIKTFDVSEFSNQFTCDECVKGVYFLTVQSEDVITTLPLIIN